MTRTAAVQTGSSVSPVLGMGDVVTGRRWLVFGNIIITP